MKIDVIIPLYRPGKELFALLDMLQKQTVPVNNYILMNTEEKYFEELMFGVSADKLPRNAQVHHLSKREFDHGGTRRRGVSYSDADIFVCMTQDAMPADEYLLEKLTAHLVTGEAASAYARQLPAADCRIPERISREFNYPPQSRIKTQKDMSELGIKTFFCSNVCAAYRREIYDRLGGFPEHTIFNEDMIYASAVIREGFSIAYEAEAQVIHSHNYSNLQQFHRNFDLGVSQAEYPKVFKNVPSESEGKKLVRATYAELKKEGKLWLFPGFCLQCGFKLAGYKLGKNYEKLPGRLVVAFSDNKSYWK